MHLARVCHLVWNMLHVRLRRYCLAHIVNAFQLALVDHGGSSSHKIKLQKARNTDNQYKGQHPESSREQKGKLRNCGGAAAMQVQSPETFISSAEVNRTSALALNTCTSNWC